MQEAEDAFHKWASTEPWEQDVKDQIEKAYIEGSAYKPVLSPWETTDTFFPTSSKKTK